MGILFTGGSGINRNSVAHAASYNPARHNSITHPLNVAATMPDGAFMRNPANRGSSFPAVVYITKEKADPGPTPRPEKGSPRKLSPLRVVLFCALLVVLGLVSYWLDSKGVTKWSDRTWDVAKVIFGGGIGVYFTERNKGAGDD